MSENQEKYYTEMVVLPSGATVELRGMKTREMDILANKKAMKDGEGINDIAKACIVSKPEDWNYDAALQGDRYAIIVNIRRITYGDIYQFKLRCPSCEAASQYKVDINKLETKPLDGRPTKGLEFTLPRSGKKVIYHLPTGVDEKELVGVRKKYPDSLMSMALMVYTDEVEGLKMKKHDFFLDLDAADVVAYQDALDDANCGINTTIELECPHCDLEYDTELPITSDFFLPKKAGKR